MNWFKSFWKALTTPPAGPRVSVSGQAPPRTAPTTASTEIQANFTPRAQKVLALARGEAERFNHHFVGTEHLLLGIVALEQGTAVAVLRKMGIDLESVRREVETQVGRGPDEKPFHPPYTPRVKKVLALAAKEAKALNHTYVGTEHILLGLLREGDGVGGRVLKNLGLDMEQTRQQILTELNPNYAARAEATAGSGCSAASAGAKVPSQPSVMLTMKGPREPLDTSKRYDVYCGRWGEEVVYHNALFKGVK